jgi:3-hydroxyacyl-CoA dehydrogenase
MSKNIAVLGAGLVGRGWAIVFARAGHEVHLYDIAAKKIEDAFQVVEENLADLAANGLLAHPEEVRGRIRGTTDLEAALQKAGWVQECAFETIETKREMFATLDEKVPTDVVLASSTSTFPASKFTSGLQGRHRCLVAHPINPPYLVPLVEIVPAPWTSPEITGEARKFMLSVRQAPIVLKREAPGFIVNRLQVAVLNEAFRLVEDDVVSVADLDRAIADGLGLRWAFMGPFETVDLNAHGGIRDYVQRFGQPYYEIALDQAHARRWNDALVAKVEQERRKLLSLDRLPERQRWRDLYLMSIVANKNSRTE